MPIKYNSHLMNKLHPSIISSGGCSLMFINLYPSVSVCRRQRSEERERGEWALTSERGTEGLSASGCHPEDTDTRKLHSHGF